MISVTELVQFSKDGGIFLDVRLEEDYKASRLRGAKNACVFEMAFMQKVPELLKGQEHTPVVLYSTNSQCHAPEMALEKLTGMGFSNVRIFEGGVAQAPAELLEKSDESPEPQFPEGTRRLVDVTESKVTWTGRNLINNHTGTINLLPSGENWLEILAPDSFIPVGGVFTLDMETIKSIDLADRPKMHDMLIHHLKGGDFFLTSSFPTATYEISGARAIDGVRIGGLNVEIDGNLTLRGITQPITFRAAAGHVPGTAGQIAFQGTMLVDRTKFGILYGSGNFFANLAGHMVADNIEIAVRVLTQK